VVEFLDLYADYGDRICLHVFSEIDGELIYTSPALELGWGRVESWIEAARKEVGKLMPGVQGLTSATPQ
jgi:hypothetical protein